MFKYLSSTYVWQCQDVEVPGENAECEAAGFPHECCTGLDTGTCDDFVSTCFSDVFDFQIACPRDDGKTLGAGNRQVIWNRMKQDVLSPSNDGTFE